ncbi:MAG: CopD family protein [Burkholderiaceae bacterium]|nr:CopD family protein [Burkholderiaceae bacterium]MDO9089459.1 CopD family protein [Burkholderiaceae bacterium]MDP1968140.1 CopD family protein [Burkholderiaceae bacterium]
MQDLIKLLHLAGAIVWLGGMTFMLVALRPAAHALLQPPQRLPLIAAVVARFFVAVWLSVAALLFSGLAMLLAAGMKGAPLGWHLMLGIGLLMFLVFGHLHFGPWRRMKLAVAAADWPEGGRRMGQVTLLVKLNFVLGWVAVAAVVLVH